MHFRALVLESSSSWLQLRAVVLQATAESKRCFKQLQSFSRNGYIFMLQEILSTNPLNPLYSYAEAPRTGRSGPLGPLCRASATPMHDSSSTAVATPPLTAIRNTMIRNESLDREPGFSFLGLGYESLRQEFATFEQKCDQIG